MLTWLLTISCPLYKSKKTLLSIHLRISFFLFFHSSFFSTFSFPFLTHSVNTNMRKYKMKLLKSIQLTSSLLSSLLTWKRSAKLYGNERFEKIFTDEEKEKRKKNCFQSNVFVQLCSCPDKYKLLTLTVQVNGHLCLQGSIFGLANGSTKVTCSK